MQIEPIYLLLFLMAVFLVCLIVVIVLLMQSFRKNEELKEYIRKEISEKDNSYLQMNLALHNSLNAVRTEVGKDFSGFNSNLKNDLDQFETKAFSNILQMEERLSNDLVNNARYSNEIFRQINERMVRIDETQKGLEELSKDIISLQSLLQDKKTRGTFGETELYFILEKVYGNDGQFYAKQYHFSNGSIADAVLFGSGTLDMIAVDSKFPLENYNRSVDANLDKTESDTARKEFKKDVFKHINDIHDKYIIPGETSELALMFIPAEAIFSEIHSSYPEIVQKAYESKVYLVSPSTLMAYVTAIKSLYLGQKKDEKAKEIEALLIELNKEFAKYKDRLDGFRKDFERIIPDFEKLTVTGNKILKRFDSINSGNIDDD